MPYNNMFSKIVKTRIFAEKWTQHLSYDVRTDPTNSLMDAMPWD